MAMLWENVTLEKRKNAEAYNNNTSNGLPTIELEQLGGAIPDSGCYVPLISAERLTSYQRRNVRRSEF
jgi:hypothetical protein